jgi:tetratricopeptide (TPR) repeat protein
MDLFREILERLNRVAPHDEGVRRLQQQTGSTQAPYGAASMEPPPPAAPEPPPPQPRFQAPPPQPTPEPPRFQPPPAPQAAPTPRNPYPQYPNDQPAAVYAQPAPPPAPPRPNVPDGVAYQPPPPAPMPPSPRGGPPAPAFQASRPQAGVYELDENDNYEDVEEVVEDAEVVEEENYDDEGGQAEYTYEQDEEEPAAEEHDGYGATQDRPGGGFGQTAGFGSVRADATGGFGAAQPRPFGQMSNFPAQANTFPPSDEYGGAAEHGYEEQSHENAGYEDEEPPQSQPDTTEMINRTLEEAAAFRSKGLYQKALDCLRASLDIEPRSMDLHEVYRDVLIESELTEEAVEEMLVIASLYVDALDGDSAARALQDVLAFDPTNERAIQMLQELGYEIVDEGENLDASQSIDGSDPYAEEGQQERLPSYDMEEMQAADVSPHYADDRQIHVGRGASQAPAGYGEEDAVGGESLPSFPLDEQQQEADAYNDAEEHIPSVRPFGGSSGSSASRRPSASPSVQPESAAELRAQPPAFGKISMVPRGASKAPPSFGAQTRELEDALDEAEFFCSRGLFDDARAILTEQLSKHPNHPLLQERLGELDSQEDQRGSGAREKPQDRHADAFDLAEGLDALEYANIEPAEGHANEEEQVDVEEVFAKFKEGVAKQISVDDYGAHYDLGIAYKEMSLLDDAIREFDVAAGDLDRECVCRSMIGMIEIERGRVNEAIESFLQGLNARIKEPQQETVLCYEIGAAYEVKKMTKDALSYFQKAMRRDPNYRDVQERVRRLAKAEPPKQPVRQAAVGADDEFDRAFDDLLSKA